MPDRVEDLRVKCSGGLYSSDNHLDLSDNMPGAATQLINYEPSLFGGYRRIEGYEKWDAMYPEVGAGSAEGKVLCVAFYRNEHLGNPYLIAARKDKDKNTYSFWYHTPYIGWRKMGHTEREFSRGLRTVEKVRFVQYDFGFGSHIVFVDGVNTACMFDGKVWFDIDPSGDGTEALPGGDQLINHPSVVDVFENHLFLSGDDVFQSVVAHSAPRNVLDFTNANGAGQLIAGFRVVQIKPFRDNLFVFGTNSIKKIVTDLEAGFVQEQVTANVGCISPDSVVEVGGDLMFLAPDGLRPVAGTSRIGDVELETISAAIKSLLVDAVTGSNLPTFNGVVVRAKSQVRYFVDDGVGGTAVNNSQGLIGAMADGPNGMAWEFGRLIGIRATCCTSEYIGAEEYVLHGDYDGCVYRQESGTDFNGEDIIAIYRTPYLDMGETERRKTVFKINTFIRAEGPFEMNLGVDYDWGNDNTSSPSTYTVASLGGPTVYGGGGVDYGAPNIIYGGNNKPVIHTNVQGSGFSVRATYVTVGKFEPYTIQALVFEHSVEGRR